MNIVFLGTPEIAKVCLEEILKTDHKVLAVVTNPDKPTGRGQKLAKSPVKIFAEEKGLNVLQFESISREGVETLKVLKPDVLVLVAFGQILSEEILNIALPINLHGSLLPALRGPSPIQTAILEGLTETGVSIMRMEKGVDSGPVMLQKTVEILPEDTSGTLFEKMASVGAKTLVKALEQIENGTAIWTQQNHEKATFCQMLTKEKAHIDFNKSSEEIVNLIRAYNPNPIAFFELGGEKFKVFTARTFEGAVEGSFKSGQIALASPKIGLIIKTADGFIEIVEFQPQGKGRMTAKSYLNGKKLEIGERVN